MAADSMTLRVAKLAGNAHVRHLEVSLPRIEALLEPPSRYTVRAAEAQRATPDRTERAASSSTRSR